MSSKKIQLLLGIILGILLLAIAAFFFLNPSFKSSNQVLSLRQSLESEEIKLRNDVYASVERPMDCPEAVFQSDLSLQGIYDLFLIGPSRCYLDQKVYEYLDSYLGLRDQGKILGVETLEFVSHMLAWFKAEIPYINNLSELLIFSFYIQRALEAKVILANQSLLNTFNEIRSHLISAWQSERTAPVGNGQYFINIRASLGELVSVFE